VSVSAYHCYHLNIAEEAYEAAEQEYELLQVKVFNIAGNDSSGEEEENDDVSEVYSNEESNDYYESQSMNSIFDAVSKEHFCAKVFGRVMHVNTTMACACKSCRKEFAMQNKLFAHLRTSKHQKKAKMTLSSNEIEVIESDAPNEKVETGYAFRDHQFTEIKYCLSPKHLEDWGCLDFGSSMSLINEGVLSQLPWTQRTFLKEPVEVQGMGQDASQTHEAATFDVYFSDKTGQRLAKVTREFHIVPTLDCGIIFGNDIITLEKIIIDTAKKRATIGSCKNFACNLHVTPKKKITKHQVRCAVTIEIAAQMSAWVTIRYAKLLFNQNYIFKPFKGNVYLFPGYYVLRSIITGNQTDILVTNVTDEAVKIYKNMCIGTMESFHNYTSVKF